jgi:predicted ATPase/class 3 adenylate cyclase
VPRCPQCGQENRAEARFCDACGAALAPLVVKREERKVVSVLFADLVGFTATAEVLDPEDVRGLQEPYWQHVRAEIERHGGTVEKFIGDAVVGLFGAPVTHEDDAERAIRAALTVRDWAQEQEGIQVRIAVTTGEALVRLGARPLAGEGMASGDVVNTASRLQSQAPANGIVVDERTFRATRHVIDYDEPEPVSVKGKERPVAAWAVIQARSRFGVDVIRHGRTPLVGRTRELELTLATLARVRAESAPQLLTIVGVPGIGKSRLVYELMQAVAADPSAIVTWRQGRSLPYGDGVTFWALAEIVKADAGILETDRDDAAREKLARAVRQVVADDGEAGWVERHLHPLIGVGGTSDLSDERRAESAAAWRRFFEAHAEARPLVLVFEDLHWADDGLLDFVDGLVEWVTHVPLLVVATARPELLERRPNWSGGKANATTLSLSALSEEETERLVNTLLEQSPIGADTRATLTAHAAGNALYAEQYVQMLGERDNAEKLPMPETVHGIIAARLDALREGEKTLLQNAAIYGKVFWDGAVLALDGIDRESVKQWLHGLDRKEFIQRARQSSVAGESEYSFRHILFRDVAYSQIPRNKRAEKHDRAAAWIESLGRPEDHAELLAHHYVAALEFAQATGRANDDLAQRARRALVAAGERAAAVTAFSWAAKHYERALELSVAEADERPLLLFAYAEALHALGDKRQTQALQDAKTALLAVGDTARAAEVEAMLASAAWLHGQRDESAAHVEEALRLAHDSKSEFATARVLGEAARQRLTAGDFKAAIKLGREALALAERAGLEEFRTHDLITIGTARGRSGDPGGIAEVEEGLSRAVATNSLIAAARAYNNLAILVVELQGDLRRGRTLFEAALGVAERIGDRELSRFNRMTVARYEYLAGEWDTALEAADAFIAECEAGRIHLKETDARIGRALIRGARGDVDGALEDIARAVAHGRETESAEEHCGTLSECIELCVQLRRAEKAKELVEDLTAIELGTDHGLLWPEFALVAEDFGLLDLVRRKLGEVDVDWVQLAVTRPIADGRLVQAADVARGQGLLPLAADIRLRAARALAETGEPRVAEEQVEQALSFYRSVGATRFIREAEQLRAAISCEQEDTAQPHASQR